MPKLAQQPLTELAIRKAKPADKRYDLFDASVRGLGLRVATSGTKSWFMMRRINGRMLRTTFGRYPEVSLALARLKAPDVLADMADGQTAGQRRTDLFRVVLDEWLKKDPIDRLVQHLQQQQGQLSTEEWKQMDDEILREVEESVNFAKNSPFPGPDKATEDVFA